MKILYVQKVKAFAGSEKYLIELIPALINRGYNCKLVCVIHKQDQIKLKHFQDVIAEKHIPCEFIFTDKDLSLQLLTKLNKIAKLGEYDLIHLNLIHAEFWFALIKTFFRLKTTLVSTVHGFDENFQAEHGFNPEKIRNTKYVRILKFNEKRISKYFAVSKGLQNLMIKGAIIPKEKISIINYGFDYPEKNNAIIPDNAIKVILVPGRLVSYKGQNFAIDMLPKLESLGIKAKLVIAGDHQSDFAIELKSQVKDLKLKDKVDFVGHVSNIDDYYQAADVVLLTSKSEGFGIVLLEAFNQEKPVVAFDVPAFNTTIRHGITGLLTPCFNTQELANNVFKILTDKNLSEKIVKNAKQDLNTYYCLERMVTETMNFYSDSHSLESRH